MTNILQGKTPEEIAALKISAAKSMVMSAEPFFGFILLSAPFIADPKVPTMAVDGANIYYGPSFVNELSIKQLAGVMVHEVLHCALLHISRKGFRNHIIWNIAVDVCVNAMIATDRALELPDDVIQMPEYAGMSAEEIYAQLLKNPPPIIKKYELAYGPGGQNGKSGESDQSSQSDQSGTAQASDSQNKFGSNGIIDQHVYDKVDGQSKEEKAINEQKWKGILSQAAVVARQQGKLPSNFERLIGETLEDTAPWEQLLARYLTPFVLKTDFSWMRPNKKALQHDMIMPGFVSEALEIAVAIDTSGSISYTDICRFFGELRRIMGLAKSYTIHLFPCDAEVHGYYKITENTQGLPKKLADGICGGGGTDFRPVFAEIDKRNLRPCLLVYFTDGWGTFPAQRPYGYEIMWAVVPGGITKKEIPWGVYVPLKGLVENR